MLIILIRILQRFTERNNLNNRLIQKPFDLHFFI